MNSINIEVLIICSLFKLFQKTMFGVSRWSHIYIYIYIYLYAYLHCILPIAHCPLPIAYEEEEPLEYFMLTFASSLEGSQVADLLEKVRRYEERHSEEKGTRQIGNRQYSREVYNGRPCFEVGYPSGLTIGFRFPSFLGLHLRI